MVIRFNFAVFSETFTGSLAVESRGQDKGSKLEILTHDVFCNIVFEIIRARILNFLSVTDHPFL